MCLDFEVESCFVFDSSFEPEFRFLVVLLNIGFNFSSCCEFGLLGFSCESGFQFHL